MARIHKGLNSVVVNHYLKTFSAEELKTRCKSLGVEISGSKTSLVDNILEAIPPKGKRFPEVNSVVSVDIGLKNLAFAIITRDTTKFRVTDWQRVDLDLPKSYSPSEFARIVTSLAHAFPKADAYLIERQHHRSAFSAVIEQAFLGSIVEAQLHMALLPKAIPIRPKAVAAHFDLGKEKKKEAVSLVSAILEENKLIVPKALKDMFHAEKKKDDLSDSLLQGLAFYAWRDNIREEASFVRNLESSYPHGLEKKD